MAVKKKSYKGKGSFASYKASDRFTRNKIRSLTAHLRKYPNDETAKAALDKIQKSRAATWVRRKPVKKGGWNRARFSESSPNSRESILATLRRADAMLFAHTSSRYNGDKAPVTKDARKLAQAAAVYWGDLYDRYMKQDAQRAAARNKRKLNKGA